MRLIPRVRGRGDRGRPMTVVQHLEELRTRVLISVIAVALGAVVGWILFPQVFRLLLHSYTEACRQLPLKDRPPTGCSKLVVQGVVEPFILRFKVAAFTGLALALP